MLNILRKFFPFNTGILTTLLLIIQSCGIRFFNGQGYLLALIIIGMSYKGFSRLNHSKAFNTLIVISIYLIINKLVNDQFEYSALIYQLLLVFEACIFLLSYSKINQFSSDFFGALKLVFIHSALGYTLYLIFPLLYSSVLLNGTAYKTLFFIFYLADIEGIRNTGILWEPGLLQLMLNILLFLSIKRSMNWKYLLVLASLVFTTFSTVGFVILGLNLLFFVYTNFNRKKNIAPILVVVTLTLLSLSLVYNNISNKVGGGNTSGLIRYRDFLIGVELIKEKPFVGHGNFNSSYLSSKSSISKIETNLFTSEYLDLYDTMSGGYTNGLLGLICWYGIPFAFLCYFFLYNNSIIVDATFGRIIFFLIVMLTFISEPITYTSLFLIFPLSYFIHPVYTKKIAKK